MKNPDSFSKVLNEIFYDFECEIPVVVFYNAARPGPGNPQKSWCRVESVNGYLTLSHFNYGMNELLENLMNGISEAEEQLAPEDSLLFLQQAMTRSKNLMSAITPMHHHDRSGKFVSTPGKTRWVFRKPCCINLDSLDEPEGTTGVIRLRVSRHAELWHRFVRQIRNELYCLYNLRKAFPDYTLELHHFYLS